MAYVHLSNQHPGIVGLLEHYPNTAQHLSGLAQELLRGPSTLSPAERELIASFVSARNECAYCENSHSAASRHLFGSQASVVETVKRDPDAAAISDKMKALLSIAGRVQESGSRVTPEDVAKARSAGATDDEIHITVLIAAAFCMYNRYVDGLGTWAPEDPDAYAEMGKHLAEVGYVN